MHTLDKFYIGGEWVNPSKGSQPRDIINPASEQVIGSVMLGTAQDADRAVAAARAAFASWSTTSRETRLALLARVIEQYKARLEDLAQAVSAEMGAPLWLARELQAPTGLGQLATTLAALKDYEFETHQGTTRVVREAVGVTVLITPWNWPLNQIAAKVAPALAAGCTVVLKPSEVAPLNAFVLADIFEELGAPAFKIPAGRSEAPAFVDSICASSAGPELSTKTCLIKSSADGLRNISPVTLTIVANLNAVSVAPASAVTRCTTPSSSVTRSRCDRPFTCRPGGRWCASRSRSPWRSPSTRCTCGSPS